MIATVKAALVGATVASISIYFGFDYFSPKGGYFHSFQNPVAVQSVLEDQAKYSGLYLLPQSGLNNNQQEKSLSSPLQEESFSIGEGQDPISVEKPQSFANTEENLNIPKLPEKKDSPVILVAIQQEGIPFHDLKKIGILWVIWAWVLFLASVLARITQSRSYFYHLFILSFIGLIQLSGIGLFFTFYLNFPQIVGLNASALGLSAWVLASIFMAFFTKSYQNGRW